MRLVRGVAALGADWISEEDPLPPEDLARSRASTAQIERLYQERSPWLLRFLARRTGNRDDAQDLLQESFVHLVKTGAGRGTALGQPRAYLTTIAKNLVTERARAADLRRRMIGNAHDDRTLAPDPHRVLEARDMLRRLEQVMLQLKPRRRAIFLAHRLDGLSYEEIADRWDLSVKRVEKEMSKAILDIDRLLERS